METKYSDRFNPNILLKMIEYMYIQCANITSYTNFLPNCLSPTFCNSYDSPITVLHLYIFISHFRDARYISRCAYKKVLSAIE